MKWSVDSAAVIEISVPMVKCLLLIYKKNEWINIAKMRKLYQPNIYMTLRIQTVDIVEHFVGLSRRKDICDGHRWNWTAFIPIWTTWDAILFLIVLYSFKFGRVCYASQIERYFDSVETFNFLRNGNPFQNIGNWNGFRSWIEMWYDKYLKVCDTSMFCINCYRRVIQIYIYKN